MWRLLAAVAVTWVAGCRPDRPSVHREPSVATAPDPFGEARQRMVDETLASRGITDEKVLEVMRHVPREEFVPPDVVDEAYEDSPQPIGLGSTISQPFIVATMTAAAHVTPGSRVLEIGTGSGYQAAILAELGAKVYTIELNEELARRTRAVLDNLGYGDIEMRMGDGYNGWAEAAPFDAILVTCAPPTEPQPLIEQLAIGGRMVLPVGQYDQWLTLLTRESTGVERTPLMEVNFGKMLGIAQQFAHHGP